MKGLWFTEDQTERLRISMQIKETLYSGQSEYQSLDVVDTYEYGRMLILDGIIMTTVQDEFVYHEMISLPALNTHPEPENVLVIGGGDGGAIREIIRYPGVRQATLCEIDEQVVQVSKKYLPEIAGSLDDPKVKVLFADGIKHIQENKNKYDLIIVDSTDPIGPAVGLFAKEFYQGIFEALKEDGIFVAQTDSPWVNKKFINRVFQDIKTIFPIAKLYLANVPIYPTGMWSFTMGSKKYNPLEVKKENIVALNTKYYTASRHFGAFDLPPFVKEVIK